MRGRTPALILSAALMAGGGPGASTGKAIEIERLKKLRGAVLGALGEAEG